MERRLYMYSIDTPNAGSGNSLGRWGMGWAYHREGGLWYGMVAYGS